LVPGSNPGGPTILRSSRSDELRMAQPFGGIAFGGAAEGDYVGYGAIPKMGDASSTKY